MSEIWSAYVFWMNIYGPQVATMIVFGFGYLITGRLAAASREKLLRQWNNFWTHN